MQIAKQIRTKLEAEYAPEKLDIVDESHLHAGHVGAREGGETHFRVEIVSELFTGRNRVDRQRMVYATLSEELADRVHALALSVKAPGE